MWYHFSSFYNLSTANYGNISLPGNFKNSANEIFFFCTNENFELAQMKKTTTFFFENSRILTFICVYHVAYAAQCVKYMNLEINTLYKNNYKCSTNHFLPYRNMKMI